MTSTLPAPDFPPLRGGPTLRWGILAPGGIATDWVRTLHASTDQRVHAVASRSAERASEFASKHGVPVSYGTYEQLVSDPGIDAVYIAAPNSEHHRLALMAISTGKHILVEKPLAMNASEASDIERAALGAGVFAMEAMWSRFLPQTHVIRALLDQQELGDILNVTAGYGSRVKFEAGGRLFDRSLGGGALLDLGIYPIWLALFVLGAPDRVTATGTVSSTGVDDQVALVLDYVSGAHAVVTTSLRVATPTSASICGTRGRLEFRSSFVSQSGFSLMHADASAPRHWRDGSDMRGRAGLCFQAASMALDVSNGLITSNFHPIARSIDQLNVIDEARRQLGSSPT